MASRLWLALVLFQLATAVPTPPGGAAVDVIAEARDVEHVAVPLPRTIIERDEDDDWSKHGTNTNAPVVGGPGPDHRAGVNYEKALADPTKQPELPAGGKCQYAYAHQAKNGGALSIFESGTSPIVDTNVKQGGIGDCGLGASVGAIASTGHAKLLQDRLKVTGNTYEFRLSYQGKDVTVAVDDQLPALSGGLSTCNPFLGFQPAGPSKTLFTALLEKAVAKLQSAYPEAKTYPDHPNGYLGLEGIWPDLALELFTGSKGKRVGRSKRGLDATLLKALEKCLTDDVPCVLGTPHPDDAVNLLGGESAAGGFKVPFAQNYTSAVVSLDPRVGITFWHTVDHDLQDAVNSLVPSHAWAVDKKHSTYTPGGDIRKAKVRILNPWGINPAPWTQEDAPNAVELSLPTLASIITAVFTVESI